MYLRFFQNNMYSIPYFEEKHCQYTSFRCQTAAALATAQPRLTPEGGVLTGSPQL
jgi:hypothetical protein